ncbi:Exocyst complex component 5 [Ophidiomyces ophidiicola]|nr:Exocyst complex component 5 [Ophidiomyces ophidiicola]KAI1992288.1 Exocyst complex component 5 [Ophidiomyces ophidiicola]KAI1993622.1 Exocyst complex component 5 [Ophidiomyces ophidiicola]
MPDPTPNSQNARPTTRRSIFDTGPTFTLDTFSNRDFIVKDFIESLSDSAISSTQRRSGAIGDQAFDPKPLIRTFEHAQRRLVELSGDLELRENELSAAVRRAEAQHSQNTTTLGRKLNQAIESFQKLDTSLNGPRGVVSDLSGSGNAAVETGRRLEELDRQRRRALDAHFLIECWDEVSNRGEVTLLENMRRTGGGEGMVRSAHIARQLLRISQRLDPSSWSEANGNGETPRLNGETKQTTRELIEKFSETLEKDLLKQFDDFYRRANFEGMRECAKVLHDFSGGSSVIGLFVNQHQFFIDRSQLINDETVGDPDTWEKLADPDAEPPGVESSLQSLVDEVKVVVQEESGIIKRIFPFYEQVLGTFVQRVFQQSIQQQLELVLEKASSVSSLAFLRSLQTARAYISGLVDDLKAHGLTEHPDAISSQTATVLDQQLEELFIPYFTGYIERERGNLEEEYTSLLFKFSTFHVRRKKTPTTFISSLAKSGSELIASARDAYLSRLDTSDFTPTQRKMLLRVAGLKETDDQKQAEIELTNEDGQLNIGFAKRMLKWLAEGVGRGLELNVGSETPKDVAGLLNMLLSMMGEGYLEMALDASLESAISQESGKSEPEFEYLSTLRTAVNITHLMLTCINTVLIPLAASNITIRRDMEKKTGFAISRIEEKVNLIEQKTVDGVLAWISRVLSSQKKNDFRPKEGLAETGWLEMLQTPTCASISGFLSRLQGAAITSLPSSDKNIKIFLTEIALGTRTLLLEHFKKFPVNGPGGLMVTKDMTRYTELLRSWDIDDGVKGVGGTLDVLLEVGSLFVVGPEALRERVRAGTTGGSGGGSGGGAGSSQSKSNAGLSVQEVRAYVLRREDSGSVAMQSVLNAL